MVLELEVGSLGEVELEEGEESIGEVEFEGGGSAGVVEFDGSSPSGNTTM